MTFSCRHHTIILENVWALRSFLSWVCRRGKEPCMEEIKVREIGSQREEEKQNQEFIMLPTVDFCFKELMKNPRVRRGFIAALLKKEPEEVEETEVLPGEQPGEYEDEKLGILDVLIRFRDGSRMNLEMQMMAYGYWKERVLFYLCRIYTGQLKKGESYDKLKKCVHVSVLGFNQFPEDETCFRVFHMKEEGTQTLYSDKLEIMVLELKKLPPEAQSEEGVVRWMRFLSGKGKEDLAEMAEKDLYLKEAYEELERLSMDEEKRYAYEAREKALRDHISMMNYAMEKGLQEGRDKGYAEGREEGREEGCAEGEEKTSRLFEFLIRDRRYEDMNRAVQDREFRKKLFKEYQL